MLIGKYRLFRIIGDGSFSTVKLGYHIFTNEPVAVKIINKSTIPDMDAFNESIVIMRMLDHPGIVKLLDLLEDESAYYLVLEYCGGGELFDFIISRTRVEEPLAKRFFKQIVLAVGYCHSMNVVHRDLKPENLLLTDNNTVKLIDFGLSNVHADQPLTDRCGSACYIAPEALTTNSYYGVPADIWALGVILYALVDGSLPWNYQDSQIMFQQITTGDFPMPTALSIQCQDLLRGILNPNPAQRFKIDDILMHPWLFGVGNVFPLPKRTEPQASEVHLNLSLGGFSASDVHQGIGLLQAQQPKLTLSTIFEDNNMQNPRPQLAQILNPTPNPTDFRNRQVKTARRNPVQPRSISLNDAQLTDPTDDGTTTHHGPIMSQTISHRDPNQVAQNFENTLISQSVNYRKLSTLIFQLNQGPDLQVTAEVCRLSGFRNVYVISFRRIKGDSWQYTQYVSGILNAFKNT